MAVSAHSSPPPSCFLRQQLPRNSSRRHSEAQTGCIDALQTACRLLCPQKPSGTLWAGPRISSGAASASGNRRALSSSRNSLLDALDSCLCVVSGVCNGGKMIMLLYTRGSPNNASFARPSQVAVRPFFALVLAHWFVVVAVVRFGSTRRLGWALSSYSTCRD